MLIFSAFLTIQIFSQDTSSQTDTLRKYALKVYMESPDFIRKEITFINYVRDLREADLYFISAYQATGSGGMAYTYFLAGRHKYEGMKDTIAVDSLPYDIEDNIRTRQVNA